MYEITWKNENGIMNTMTVGTAVKELTERDRVGNALLVKTELLTLTDLPDGHEADISVKTPDGDKMNFKEAMAHLSEITRNSEAIDHRNGYNETR